MKRQLQDEDTLDNVEEERQSFIWRCYCGGKDRTHADVSENAKWISGAQNYLKYDSWIDENLPIELSTEGIDPSPIYSWVSTLLLCLPAHFYSSPIHSMVTSSHHSIPLERCHYLACHSQVPNKKIFAVVLSRLLSYVLPIRIQIAAITVRVMSQVDASHFCN